MKKNFTYQKKIRNVIIAFALIIFLMLGGCYTISYIIQPEVVDPNSEFNVKICVVLDGYEESDYTANYGILGIILPEGWTVKDNPEYKKGNDGKPGYFQYSEEVVSFLADNATKPPAGYKWWGAISRDLVYIGDMDSGFINLTILTNEKTGQFLTKYVIGDDNEFNKSAGKPFKIVKEWYYLPIKAVGTSNSEKLWENEDWDVFPNPSDGKFNVSIGNISDDITMRVYDLTGRLQKSEILHESLNRIDLTNFSKGTYIVSLEKQGETKTKKIIIH